MSPNMFLNADEVNKLLPKINVLEELRNLFIELGQNKAIQPPQTLTVFPEDTGDYITYLGAWTGAGVFGAKLSPYITTETTPIITAWTVLMSAQTGQPLLLCDAGQLTIERTAATTALAIDYLIKENHKKVAIIGSGAIAQTHLKYVKNLRNWQSASIYSPDLNTNKEKQMLWKNLCPQIEFCESSEQAAIKADLVMLCTSSGTPVIDGRVFEQQALITSISTNVPEAHEIAPEFLNHMQVYCDYKNTTPASAGDMVIAARDHGWSLENIDGDLPDLTNGFCPLPNTERPTYFRSIGLGLEDIAIAKALHLKAKLYRRIKYGKSF